MGKRGGQVPEEEGSREPQWVIKEHMAGWAWVEESGPDGRRSQYLWSYGGKVAQIRNFRADGMGWGLGSKDSLGHNICRAPGDIRLSKIYQGSVFY